MSRSPARSFALFVLAACVLHVALVALARPGFMSSDDEVYARLAHDLSVGDFHLIPEHRANRLGMIAPTAAAYALLGVGLWTTVLVPLFWSLVGIVLVALVARRIAGERAGILAALLFASLTTVVNGSAFLIPDGPSGVQMLAASACLWLARQESGRRAAAWGGAAALVVVAGVLTKLTILWLAPLFGVLFVRDLVAGRNRAAWLAFAATGVVGAAVFFGSYAAATGDALYRLHAVDDAHNDTHWAFENAGTGEILRRITFAPALMLARALPELTLLAAIAAAVSLGARGGERRRDVLFWAGHAVAVIGCYWAGTTSFARWAPLPLLPRMLAPGAAPLAVLAAVALAGERATVRRTLLPALMLAAAGALAVADGRLAVAALYAAAAAAVCTALAAPPRLRTAGTLAVLALPLAMCGYSIARGGAGESRDMRAERHLTAELPSLVEPGAVVLTDRRSERTFAFYRSYADAGPEVLAWDDLAAAPAAAASVYVYWYPSRVAWRGGRAAPPAWLAEATEQGETVLRRGEARLVRLR